MLLKGKLYEPCDNIANVVNAVGVRVTSLSVGLLSTRQE